MPGELQRQPDVPPPAKPDRAGVIPYRRERDGSIRVLLIRRRRKRRWGVPKGIIEPDQTFQEAALQEAREEAGITGELSTEPVGGFEYTKWGRICRVQVFLMKITREYARYPEQSFRERRWFSLPDAVRCKTRKGVRPLLLQLPRLLGRTPPIGHRARGAGSQ